MALLRQIDKRIASAQLRGDSNALAHAKRLKLCAYRRMSQIADAAQPRRYGGEQTQHPGPFAYLTERGVSRTTAQQIRRIGAIPHKLFDTLLRMNNPPGVMKAASLGVGMLARARSSAAWREITNGRLTSSISLSRFVNRFCASHDPIALARGLQPHEATVARKLAHEAQTWLRIFCATMRDRGWSPYDKGQKAAPDLLTPKRLGEAGTNPPV